MNDSKPIAEREGSGRDWLAVHRLTLAQQLNHSSPSGLEERERAGRGGSDVGHLPAVPHPREINDP